MKLLKEIATNNKRNRFFFTKPLTIAVGLLLVVTQSFAANTQTQDSLIIAGKVFDKVSQHPIKAKVYYRDIPNGNIIGFLDTEDNTGAFSIELYERNQYAIEVQAAGYLSGYVVANATDENNHSFAQDLALEPIQAKQTIDLRSVSFGEDNELLVSSYDELDRLVALLQLNPTLTITVGNGAKAPASSEQRDLHLKALRHFLIKRGIARARVKLLPDASKPTSSTEQVVEVTVLKP
ncbi:hypothetical protein SAMN05421780_109161 [Flexibacter flexilis DSM 6793]|uniref:Uncharacterized protein n=1 Tax=Flexibacter flexilis DSM 6793 TaxID=927664 RepID=A0A1I1M3Y2_9BACT|nr:hypothetical protein [Flexibacter flexilis]SFC77333.1 hypothetical protein SAMN05421780_109161 [Flexibacter flexilis DSM 6793]